MKKNLIISTLFFAAHLPTFATALLFDITGQPNNGAMNQAYGDNVTATTMGTFGYGAAGGFTPNVTVSYGPMDGSPVVCPEPFNASDSCIFSWDVGYSGLTNVIGQSNRGVNNGLIQIVLTASSGFSVQLLSLDLGSFDGVARTINGVRVLDSSNAVVFNSGALALGAAAASVSPNVTSSQLTLIVDASNLALGAGELIGLDNVTFSQIVGTPEPTTMALAAGALALLALNRRKR